MKMNDILKLLASGIVTLIGCVTHLVALVFGVVAWAINELTVLLEGVDDLIMNRSEDDSDISSENVAA